MDLNTVLTSEARYIQQRRRLAVPHEEAYADRAEYVGLALSGGGIRSATINLGVLQALSELSILPRVDYLSTVSGGGYIGSALSSLLSIKQNIEDASRHGSNDQFVFIPPDQPQSDQPVFTPAWESFPFNPSGEKSGHPGGDLTGKTIVEHLRTHGDFLIRRKRLFSRDVLRTVGALPGGIFYHLLVFTLLLVAVAGAFMMLLQFLIEDTSPIPIDAVAYLRGLLGLDLSVSWQHPLLLSVGSGVAVLLPAMLLTGWLCWRLPDSRFRQAGRSIEETRGARSIWILVVIAILLALILTILRGRLPGDQWVVLAIPFGVFAGGWLLTLALHAVVSVLPRFGRNDRSRFAAWKGVFHYLMFFAGAVALFPLAIRWLADVEDLRITGGLSWVASVVATGFLSAKPGEGKLDASKWTAILRALWARAHKVLLAIAVAVLILGGFLLLCAGISQISDPSDPTSLLRVRLLVLGVSLAFLALGYWLDFNKLSLHYFYRDRLVEAYLQTTGKIQDQDPRNGLDLKRDNAEMPLTHLHGTAAGTGAEPAWHVRIGQFLRRITPFRGFGRESVEEPEEPCVTPGPYHLLVTCLNLTGSRDMTRRTRRADHFIFSKMYCGSETTGYMQTARYRSGETKLARAMTISGAAATPSMGARTFFAQAFAMTLFNIRLGQWAENPRYKGGKFAYRQENLIFWPFYLFKELFGSADARRRLVYLSDGGHTGDNVGIRPLLQRRCRLIIAVDAECDRDLSFGSFAEAMRQAYIDEGVQIDIDLGRIRLQPDASTSRCHFAVGKITYPASKEKKASHGWLIVLKSSMTGNEPESVKTYRQQYPEFPHQTTADQFFDDAQFESYRELGYHMASGVFSYWSPSTAIRAPRWECLEEVPKCDEAVRELLGLGTK
jgi:hypothetical protein